MCWNLLCSPAIISTAVTIQTLTSQMVVLIVFLFFTHIFFIFYQSTVSLFKNKFISFKIKFKYKINYSDEHSNCQNDDEQMRT